MLWNNIMSYYFAEGDIYIIMQAWQLFYLINAHVKSLFNQHSKRKQTTFHGATTSFHVKLWCLRNKCRNSILMMHHYQDLGSASDWSCYMGNLLQPITSTTQIWVVTHHQYGISALVLILRRHFAGKPLVASRNVVCFLRLIMGSPTCKHKI